jgi:hypothetical protein
VSIPLHGGRSSVPRRRHEVVGLLVEDRRAESQIQEKLGIIGTLKPTPYSYSIYMRLIGKLVFICRNSSVINTRALEKVSSCSDYVLQKEVPCGSAVMPLEIDFGSVHDDASQQIISK